MRNEKHIWEGWRVCDFIEYLIPVFNMKNDGRLTKDNIKKWCCDNQPYYKKYIPEVVQHFKKLLK